MNRIHSKIPEPVSPFQINKHIFITNSRYIYTQFLRFIIKNCLPDPWKNITEPELGLVADLIILTAPILVLIFRELLKLLQYKEINEVREDNLKI